MRGNFLQRSFAEECKIVRRPNIDNARRPIILEEDFDVLTLVAVLFAIIQMVEYAVLHPVSNPINLGQWLFDQGDDSPGRVWQTAMIVRALPEAAMRRERPDGWSELQRSVMTLDWSWDRAAGAYLGLYNSMTAG